MIIVRQKRHFNCLIRQLAEQAGEKFEVFHIHIQSHSQIPPKVFQEILPGRILCILKSAVNALPEIIISTMQMVNGGDEEKVISQWSELSQPIVRNALKNVVFKQKKKGLFF